MIAQTDLEAEMLRIAELAEKATTEVAHRGQDDAECRTRYKVAFAHASLKAKVDDYGRKRTVGEIESLAIIATEDEYRAHLVAEARFKAAQEAGRNYRAQMETLRSINANLRALVTA